MWSPQTSRSMANSQKATELFNLACEYQISKETFIAIGGNKFFDFLQVKIKCTENMTNLSRRP